ncbi:ABC transporter permease [uncultured Ferrovibrio sp.]|jgi:ABC-type dipeptide/oligopeptide/nickel transport systems, permease components|uniref:ABC transporter permease n=1 Tax=uncultured Ferrovibrio sp. TaxID=1576913 RepID=UPI0026352E31|nr:ABC transporter permease [uncultured Ferrovibrio sp.]
MLRLVLSRLMAAIPVMGVVAVFVFLLLRLSPGDPAAILAGDAATVENIAAIRADLGLDKPLPEQFVTWMGQLLQGDLGRSVFSKQPVTVLIGQRIEPTISLALMTLLFSVLVAVPMGIIAAWRQGGWLDRGIMALSVAGFSIPVFVLGYILIYFFSMKLDLLPVQGFASLSEGILPFLERITLPMVTLSFIYIALFARITRAAMLEVLGEDYIRTAHAKGLKENVVLVKHALRNAAIPIVSVIGIGFALMIGGVVVTETVFNIPGVGRLVVDAVLARDYPIIQGVILLFSGVYVLINLAIDVAYVLLDPRIRY